MKEDGVELNNGEGIFMFFLIGTLNEVFCKKNKTGNSIEFPVLFCSYYSKSTFSSHTWLKYKCAVLLHVLQCE